MDIVDGKLRNVEVQKVRQVQETYTEMEEHAVLLIELTESDIKDLSYHGGLGRNSGCRKLLEQIVREFYARKRHLKEQKEWELNSETNWLRQWEADTTPDVLN